VIAAACGVLGLRYGADAMPRQWQRRLPHVADCLALAPALLRARGVGSTEPSLTDQGGQSTPRLRLLPSALPAADEHPRGQTSGQVVVHDIANRMRSRRQERYEALGRRLGEPGHEGTEEW
jgi:hypothetical protein